ncbi:hypothetical protein [Nitrobacter sp. TKz-YC02]|uniref:hypothetical protein n=1 Tax=Nitrobacter sp. TKz-YC02 TaxID=3398704 RepID=UPI003CF698E8
MRLKLEPGATVGLWLFRFAHQPLKMELWFSRKGCNDRRPELGDPSTRVGASGKREPVDAGRQVRLIASLRRTSIIFEASAPWAYSCHLITRPLRPGGTETLSLEFGFNPTKITVDAVDPALTGETVQLAAMPPLGFKFMQENVSWLAFWFAWPFFLLFQLTWAGLLVLFQAKKSR